MTTYETRGRICQGVGGAYTVKLYDEAAHRKLYPAGSPLCGQTVQLFDRSKGKHAQLLAKSDYKDYDYIIGMDSENRRWMPRILGGDPEEKISLLLDFTDHPRSVADPWYTGNFEATYNDVVEGCTAFLEYLKSEGIL